MPFSPSNAPATFQHFVNHVLRKYVDCTCVAYLDNIMVFSKNKDEDPKHVCEILQALRKASCTAKIEKCWFHQDSLNFLGYIVSKEGIQTDPAKLRVVKK